MGDPKYENSSLAVPNSKQQIDQSPINISLVSSSGGIDHFQNDTKAKVLGEQFDSKLRPIA